jgi:hypothetical protein
MNWRPFQHFFLQNHPKNQKAYEKCGLAMILIGSFMHRCASRDRYQVGFAAGILDFDGLDGRPATLQLSNIPHTFGPDDASHSQGAFLIP